MAALRDRSDQVASSNATATGEFGAPYRSADICLQFASGTVQVREALDSTLEAMKAAGVDTPTCDTSQIILGEVLNNVVEHAYKFEEGRPIELSIWVRDTGLQCTILDHGGPMPNGVPPAGVLVEIDPTSREDLPEGGFGWAMVHELTEDLQYFRIDGRNELVFRIPTTQD